MWADITVTYTAEPSLEEKFDTTHQLKNIKAAVSDDVHAELIKYSGIA